MLTKTPNRTLLQAAIAARTDAAEKERAAGMVVQRAKELLVEAQESLSRFSDLDTRISSYRAEAIKNWSGGAADRPTGQISIELAGQCDARAAAQAHAASSQTAVIDLEKQHAIAKSKLASAEVATRRAAGAVLSEEAEPLIGRLREMRGLVWHLEDKLRSLSTVRYFDDDRRSVLIKMPASTFAALNETAPPMLAGSVPKPYAVALARWNAYLTALTVDPNSTLDSI
jgi:hypothetical protein